jgi:hypothetical protein
MGYADHIRDTSSQRPGCWGNSRSYDPNDTDCGECRFRHSCRAEIDRSGSIRITSSPSTYTPYKQRYEGGNSQAGVVGTGERPIERFAKDAFTGMMRGMFHEMWQFWMNYRIR